MRRSATFRIEGGTPGERVPRGPHRLDLTQIVAGRDEITHPLRYLLTVDGDGMAHLYRTIAASGGRLSD